MLLIASSHSITIDLPSDTVLSSSALPQQPLPGSNNSTEDSTEVKGQSSVAAGIGGGVGGAVVLLVVAGSVVGFAIMLRRTKSKVELQHSSGGVLSMTNPVYSGRWGCIM